MSEEDKIKDREFQIAMLKVQLNHDIQMMKIQLNHDNFVSVTTILVSILGSYLVALITVLFSGVFPQIENSYLLVAVPIVLLFVMVPILFILHNSKQKKDIDNLSRAVEKALVKLKAEYERKGT